jgi:hypothetical protein
VSFSLSWKGKILLFISWNQVVLIFLKFIEKYKCQIYIYNICTALAENKTSLTVIKRSFNNDQNIERGGKAINFYCFPSPITRAAYATRK